MPFSKPVLAVAASLFLAACGGSGSGSGESSGTTTAPAKTADPKPGATPPATTPAPATTTSAAAVAATPSGGGIAGASTLAGAKAALANIQKAADQKAEFKKLKPGLDELKALFSEATVAEAVSKQIEEMMAKDGGADLPKGDADVFCATSDDIKAWTPDVEKKFPGGYKRLGSKLNSGFTMCKFKIGGVSFDSLVNIKGNWFLVAKPFRAVRE